MLIKWKPFWYELDWSIIVGDVDWFDIKNDGYFYNGVLLKEERTEYSVLKLKILRITHPVLGEIKGIITIGLDYTIYLTNGEIIEVNAEENPGSIYGSKYNVSDWSFDVYANVIEEISRDAAYNDFINRNNNRAQLVEKYKTLLGISEAMWES